MSTIPPSPSTSRLRSAAHGLLLPFIMVTSLFFLWGFCHAMLDVMNKYFQGALDISKARSGLLQTAVYSGYFLMALPAGFIMRRLGYKGGILIGLALVALGAFLFIPASNLKMFEPFLIALFVLACGLTCLETAANPYVTVLGPKDTAASRLVLSQSFNAVGWILGPVVGGLLLFGAAAKPYEATAKRPVGPVFDALPTTVAQVALPPGFSFLADATQLPTALHELATYAAIPQATTRGLVFRVVDDAEAAALDKVSQEAGKGHAGVKPGDLRAIDSETLRQTIANHGAPLADADLALIPALSSPVAPAGPAHLSEGSLVKYELTEWEGSGGHRILMVRLYNFSALLMPYLVLGGIIILVFAIFFLLRMPDIKEDEVSESAHGVSTASSSQTAVQDDRPLLRRPHFTLGVLAQFLYVAGQTAVNAFALNFIIENQGGSERHASYLLGIGLAGFAIGRFTGSALLRVVKPWKLLALYGFISAIIMALVMANLKPASSMILLGSWAFMSIMFPTIFALSLQDLSLKTKIGSSFLVMAIVGGAIAPPVMGLLADRFGMAPCFVVPLLCFLYIGIYGAIYPRLLPKQAKAS